MNQLMRALIILVVVVGFGCQKFASNAPKDVRKRADAGAVSPASQPVDDVDAIDPDDLRDSEEETTEAYGKGPPEDEDEPDKDQGESKDDDDEPDDDDDKDESEPEDPPFR